MLWQNDMFLMVDPTVVTDNQGSAMVRGEAMRVHDRPVIALGDKLLNPPRSASGGGRSLADQLQVKLVVRQGGTYRMWYRMWNRYGKTPFDHGKYTHLYYAESTDGISFKPVRVNHAKGTPAHRVAMSLNKPKEGLRFSGLFFDPLDSDWPFKCVVYRPGDASKFDPGVLARFPHMRSGDWQFIWGIGRSKDGLEWHPPEHDHDMIQATPEHARLHRNIDGDLIISDQMISPMADWAYRNVKGWVTRDLVHAHRIVDYLYSVPQHMVRCNLNYTGPTGDGLPWIQPHVGLEVARKGPTFIALTGYLYGATAFETFAQTADIGLAFSETGVSFKDVWPFMPFIRRGLPGQWDAGLVRHDAIIDHGDETRFYYTGNEQGNLGGQYQSSYAQIERDRYGYRLIQGGRDVKRRDRTATFTLKPCVLPDRPAFKANVSHVNASRDVRFELRNEQGKPIPGYRFKDCQPVTRQGLSRPIRWKHSRSSKELSGKTVQMAVELRSQNCGMVGTDSPRLYAVYTRAPE